MVIAIIGILAGILIPTVGAVRTQANKAASKAQLSNYVTAITMFKGEYGYYPFSDAQDDDGANINSLADFIETLSARDDSGETISTGGNRRRISFHSFSESEFLLKDDDTLDYSTIADRFNNSQIFIAIDGDGDGEVSVPGNSKLKSSVTAYVVETDTGAPAYSLYD
jgi:type II secretory pathway pseudopilin PulG